MSAEQLEHLDGFPASWFQKLPDSFLLAIGTALTWWATAYGLDRLFSPASHASVAHHYGVLLSGITWVLVLVFWISGYHWFRVSAVRKAPWKRAILAIFLILFIYEIPWPVFNIGQGLLMASDNAGAALAASAAVFLWQGFFLYSVHSLLLWVVRSSSRAISMAAFAAAMAGMAGSGILRSLY